MGDRAFPWARPRREPLLLVLVALAALLPVYTVNAQDQSRLCLTQALLHGKVSNDECLSSSVDRASFGGHLYSDKPPGISLLEVPSAGALRLPPVDRLSGGTDARVWTVRLLASGLALLLVAFLVGRIGEGLAPGYGDRVLVAFALGTIVAPLGAANFSHVVAAATAFAAFALAWDRRFAAAGLVAGAALVVEYQTAAILLALAAYAMVNGRRVLGRYLTGLVPGAVILLAYDWAAFGSPLHTPYRYVSVKQQATGFFGIGVPHLQSTYEALAGNRGLFVASPVLLLAIWGLVVLGRTHRLEAILCAAVAAFYVILDCGYFIPYGGVSPGPRFLVPALPFLAVGLGPAFTRMPKVAATLTALSVIATTALTIVWTSNMPLRHTIWGELVHSITEGSSSRLARHVVVTALGWTRLGSDAGLAAIVAAAGFAVLATLRLRAVVAAAVAAAIVAVAAGAALLSPSPSDLKASIIASTAAAFPGDEVDFTIEVVNDSTEFEPHVKLTIVLPDEMQLLGRPTHELGTGCTGNVVLRCDIGDFVAHMRGTVHVGVRIGPDAAPTLRVTAWAGVGDFNGKKDSVTVTVGSS